MAAGAAICSNSSYLPLQISVGINVCVWEGAELEPLTPYQQDTEVEHAGPDWEGGNYANSFE